MSRIRIMHVVHSFGTGGTEEGIRKLLAGLDPDRYEQVVCTVAPSPEIEPRTGARIISLNRPKLTRMFLVRRLERVFRRERPQIVHSRNWGAMEAVLAGRLAGVGAVVHSEHGFESQNIRRQPWRQKAFRRLCFGLADCVFAVSQDLREHYNKQLGLAQGRIRVMPNGVDTDRFRSDSSARRAMRQSLGIAPQTLLVGTVGRLNAIKDHRTFFQAAESVLGDGIDIRLVIAGDGPLRESLQTDIQTSGPLAQRTAFIGESADVPSLLNALDIFVLSSLAEGMSNALLEAMSVGITPVVTRVGGNSELVDGRSCGLLFEAGDAKALAAHLEALALDPQLRRNLGENAQRRVRSCFSLNNMLASYARLYDELANDKRAHSAVRGALRLLELKR